MSLNPKGEPFVPVENTMAQGGSNTILLRPKLSELLGAICAEWGRIDNIYQRIFDKITFSKIAPSGSRTKEEISDLIFESFKTLGSKDQVVSSVIAYRYEQNVLKEYNKIAKRIRDNAKYRNELIHANWQISSSYPVDLIVTGSPNWFRYSEDHFNSVLKISTELANDFQDFSLKLSIAKRKEI